MPVPRFRFKSPVARAVVPVLGGIAFFAVLFGGLWAAATVSTNRANPASEATQRTFKVGKVAALSRAVAEDGPILFPDLRGPDGVRSIVLDHSGDDPARGWQVYYGYPADRTASCLVTHTPGTRDFVDCEGRTLGVDALALPQNVRPIVENRDTLYVDLRGLTPSG